MTSISNEYTKLNAFLDRVERSPGQFVQPLTFYTIVAFCNGFMTALGDEVDVNMHGILSEWASERNGSPSNWAWQDSVLRRLANNNEAEAISLVIPFLRDFSAYKLKMSSQKSDSAL